MIRYVITLITGTLSLFELRFVQISRLNIQISNIIETKLSRGYIVSPDFKPYDMIPYKNTIKVTRYLIYRFD